MAIFFRKTRSALDQRRYEAEAAERRAATELASVEEKLARLELLLANRVEGYRHIADAWADWELAVAGRESDYLVHYNKRTAPKAAEVVRQKGREMAELRRRMKLAEYLTTLYEFHFPWLTDLRDLDAELDYAAPVNDEPETEDPVSKLVSKEEWAALPEVERNQRALERYLHSRLTPWQLGRDYERYVGYLREQDGCLVTYHGIVRGFEDLGRDVLAERNGRLEVIQCKRWAQHKTIHEKHVFQLFGTMVAARIENPLKEVTGTFVTTTALSDRARDFAQVLEIQVEENFPLADYPRIKCNVARRTGERIYHLPFDQQYDTTTIEPRRGECYALTCAEAEGEGFRRAWRWRGERSD
jgi:hypothetical protein